MQRRPTTFISPLLQPPLHKLFVPRPFPEILPPVDFYKDGYTGPRVGPVAPFLDQLSAKPDGITEPPIERDRTIVRDKVEIVKAEIETAKSNWDPKTNPEATSDPFKTLFVGRLPYDVTERQLKREFEVYGEIEMIKMISNKEDGKPKGYAFIQFKNEDDMKEAYRDADGKKINGRRIVVDVERGRTVPAWLPRRFGGGLGKTRVGGPKDNQAYSGRDPRANDLLQKMVGNQNVRDRSRSPSDRREVRDNSSYRQPRSHRHY